MSPFVLAVIPARTGSKGLPGKNTLLLAGKPLISYTIESAQEARLVNAICVTTDSPQAAHVAADANVFLVQRPPELATDTATVDSAVRHAVNAFEATGRKITHAVILYPNVLLRPSGVIDRAISLLIETGADSVRSLAQVDKQHPDWLHRLDGDRMVQYRKNSIYRRQDLEPLFYHDGAVVACTRESLFTTDPNDAHAFLGKDRRGILTLAMTVDVDTPEDYRRAVALMAQQTQVAPGDARLVGALR